MDAQVVGGGCNYLEVTTLALTHLRCFRMSVVVAVAVVESYLFLINIIVVPPEH